MMFFIVDDDDSFRFLTTKAIELTNPGTAIFDFENAKLALSKINDLNNEAKLLPDYIFLDLNMPIMDGWGFLDEIAVFYNSLNKPISIYVVSSSLYSADKQKASTYPFVSGYIEKPISFDFLTQLKLRTN